MQGVVDTHQACSNNSLFPPGLSFLLLSSACDTMRVCVYCAYFDTQHVDTGQGKEENGAST